ncbi:MAG: hypothetical protein ACOC41_06550 [Chitinivibrionales bacterium]
MSDESQMHKEDYDSLISDSQKQVKKSHSRITLVATLLIILGATIIGIALFSPLLSAELLSGVKIFAIGFSSILVLMGIGLLVMRYISEKEQKKQQSEADKG